VLRLLERGPASHMAIAALVEDGVQLEQLAHDLSFAMTSIQTLRCVVQLALKVAGPIPMEGAQEVGEVQKQVPVVYQQ